MTGQNIARLDVESRGLTVGDALLPENYTRAVQSIEALVEIDECKAWADRAEALRSYARQADDPTLLNHAMRIKARAVRKCGELINEVAPAHGANQNINDGAATNVLTRTKAAREAGLSKRQADTAKRVANVQKASFDAAVEAANPPTVTALADMGRKRREPKVEPDPVDADDDWMSPKDSDDLLRMIVQRLRHDLMDLPPGIRGCVRDAVSRASAEDRALLRDRRDLLTFLME